MDDILPDSASVIEANLCPVTQRNRWLAAYVYSVVPRATDEEDLPQEVRVMIWKHFAKFEEGSNFQVWPQNGAYSRHGDHHGPTGAHPLITLKQSDIAAGRNNERRAFLTFDVSQVNTRNVAEAQLVHDPEPSSLGFSALIPDSRFASKEHPSARPPTLRVK